MAIRRVSLRQIITSLSFVTPCPATHNLCFIRPQHSWNRCIQMLSPSLSALSINQGPSTKPVDGQTVDKAKHYSGATAPLPSGGRKSLRGRGYLPPLPLTVLLSLVSFFARAMKETPLSSTERNPLFTERINKRAVHNSCRRPKLHNITDSYDPPDRGYPRAGTSDARGRRCAATCARCGCQVCRP